MHGCFASLRITEKVRSKGAELRSACTGEGARTYAICGDTPFPTRTVESPVLARFVKTRLLTYMDPRETNACAIKRIPHFDDAILQTVDIVLISRAAGGRTMPG